MKTVLADVQLTDQQRFKQFVAQAKQRMEVRGGGEKERGRGGGQEGG